MPRTTHRSVCSLLLSACATATSVWTVPASAGAPEALADGAVRPDRVLDHAASLVARGELVRAQAMLDALANSPAAATLGDEQGKRLWTLRSGVDRKIAEADRFDISLQRAELMLGEDNLVEAERQAAAVLRSGRADAAQVDTARAIAALIESRRAQIAPQVPEALRLAADAFAGGDYARAKGLLTRVRRSGVPLDDAQDRAVASSRAKIIELELARGVSFPTASLGMLAPESGMSSSWLTGSTQDGARNSGSYVGQPEEQTPPAVPLEIEVFDPSMADNQPEATGATQPAEVDLIEAARRFEAQTLMGEAGLAFDERRLGTAMELYRRVVAEFSAYLTGEQKALAQERLSELSAGLNMQGGPDDALNQTISDRGLARDRAVATFENQMLQARAALEQGDPGQARNLAAQARLTVQQAREVMAESEFEGRIAQVDTLLIDIAAVEEQLRISEQAATDARLAEETAADRQERQNEQDARIVAAIERVRALQQELKYEEALEVVESILFLDPWNPAGLLLQSIIEDTIIYRQFLGYQRDKNLSYAREALEVQRAMIMPDELMGYPADWPAISFRRGEPLEFAETEADRALLATLRETRLPVNFNENAFESVVAFLEQTARIDIDVDWESLADIGVDPDTPVTMQLREIPVESILDRLVAKVADPDLPAGWSIEDGVVTIASDELLRRKTVLEIYDIRDMLFLVPRFDDAPEFDLSSALQSSGGGGGGSPFQTGGQQDDEAPFEERVEAIVNLLQANIDPEGWIETGGSTSSITQLNGNFVITTTPRNHRAIIGLLGKLRAVRALQINVEARFLTVSEDFFEQIGFDLDVYFNAKNAEFTAAQQIDPSLLPSDYIDPLTGELLDNVSGGGIFGIDTDGDGVVDEFGPISQPVLGPSYTGDQWSIIGAGQNSFGLTESLAGASSFASTILGQSPALGVTGRFLDDIQVDFLVEATQADQRSVILTAPRLTFTNGQRAFIVVATQTTFVSDLEPVTSDGSGAFDPVITPLTTGVLLDLDGVVSADRRYVTLNVRTSISENQFGTDRRVEGAVGGGGGGGGFPGGGGGGGGETFEGTIQVPIVTTTQINTTVTVPDQGTVLLGGQRLIEELEIETGVPVLSKIPILSRFFSNRIDVKEEQTLIVLLKPTILIQNEEEEKNFPGLLDRLGR